MRLQSSQVCHQETAADLVEFGFFEEGVDQKPTFIGHLPFLPPESGLAGAHAEDGVGLERLEEMRCGGNSGWLGWVNAAAL